MSDEVFTASNAIEIRAGRNGAIEFSTREGQFSPIAGYQKGSFSDQALAEYYQWRHDQKLERWRHNQHLVVYPGGPDEPYRRGRGRSVMVLDERTSRTYQRFDGTCAEQSDEWDIAAHAYFTAHPVRKPWHDAKPGEVWELTYRAPSARETTDRVMTCVDDGGNLSFFNEYRLHTVQYTGIESGRRIWPEVSDE